MFGNAVRGRRESIGIVLEAVAVEAVGEVADGGDAGVLVEADALGGDAELEAFAPGPDEAAIEFFGRHELGADDDMLGVVVAPVLVENAVFGLEPAIGVGVGERRVEGEAGDIDAEFVDGRDGMTENLGGVVVEAEDEAALDHDVAGVEGGDDLVVMAGGIEPLVHAAEGGGADGFEADEEIAAPGIGHEVQEHGILGHLGGDEASPFFLEGTEGREEFLGVFGIIGQVEIVENEGVPAQGSDLGDDFADGAGAPAERDGRSDAEVAGLPAATGGIDGAGHHIGKRLLEVATGQGKSGDFGRALVPIFRAEAAGAPISQQAGPRLFGESDYDGISMGAGFFGNKRHMDAAEDDGGTPRPEMVGQFVALDRHASDEANGDEIERLIEGDG